MPGAAVAGPIPEWGVEADGIGAVLMAFVFIAGIWSVVRLGLSLKVILPNVHFTLISDKSQFDNDIRHQASK